MKISIITVCFNSEKTILDTLNSVLNQTYKNIEHIIVDGKSKDKTNFFLKKYPLKNKKIYSLKKMVFTML
jgi:glycosyltransferase involved in cell wall biosynthesis